MQCAACGTANDPGRVYCGSCASCLGAPCPDCQFFNGAGIRYCGGCARALPAAGCAPAPAVVPAVHPASVAGPRSGAVARADAARSAPGMFDDLEDLLPGAAPLADGAPSPAPAADPSQEEIDGFFTRLVREGNAEIVPPGTLP